MTSASLDKDGFGRCSVPMFSNEIPAGFCGDVALGFRPRSPERMNYCAGVMQREDGLYNGYVPGLACKCHGGPSPKISMDGNQFCATTDAFDNLQESPAGFGDTEADAVADLFRQATGGQP
jgi:hypothetical protein